MVLAQWLVVAVAALGAVVAVLLALRLWRQVKKFVAMLGAGSATLAQATAALEAAQSAGSVRSGSEAAQSAYTRINPTRRADS